jgi:putative hemolysin
LEGIVGEIRDEYDAEEERPIQALGDGVFLVDGGVPVSELKEDYHLSVEETAAYHTLAGFVLARLERIPKGGETVVHDGYRFTVVDVDGRRIAKVKVEKLDGAVSAPSAGEPGSSPPALPLEK